MKLLRDVLRTAGYETLEATTGLRAVELAIEHKPDIVLVDVQLPDISGVEALGHLRANRRTASRPVLALTAQAMHGDRERFLAAGFDSYIAKPRPAIARYSGLRAAARSSAFGISGGGGAHAD